jgi:DNA-binding IclR family transcriptional regulator
MTGRQPKAVRQALAMLEAVSRMGPGVTAAELARELGLPPSTTYRLVNLLVGDEYLVRLADLSGFALGRRVAELTGTAAAPVTSRAVRAELARVRAGTRWAVHLAAYAPRRVQVVEPDPDHTPAHPSLLARYPHGAALGKLLLAEAADWPALLPGRRLLPATTHTLATHDAVAAELADVARHGYAHQVEELVDGRACVAVAIRGEDGRLVAALAAGGAAAAWPDQRAGLLDLLRSSADQLAPLLA